MGAGVAVAFVAGIAGTTDICRRLLASRCNGVMSGFGDRSGRHGYIMRTTSLKAWLVMCCVVGVVAIVVMCKFSCILVVFQLYRFTFTRLQSYRGSPYPGDFRTWKKEGRSFLGATFPLLCLVLAGGPGGPHLQLPSPRCDGAAVPLAIEVTASARALMLCELQMNLDWLCHFRTRDQRICQEATVLMYLV